MRAGRSWRGVRGGEAIRDREGVRESRPVVGAVLKVGAVGRLDAFPSGAGDEGIADVSLGTGAHRPVVPLVVRPGRAIRSRAARTRPAQVGCKEETPFKTSVLRVERNGGVRFTVSESSCFVRAGNPVNYGFGFDGPRYCTKM